MTIQPQGAAQASAQGGEAAAAAAAAAATGSVQKCKWFLTTMLHWECAKIGNLDWQSYLWHELESAKVEGDQQSQMHCSLAQHRQEDIQAEDGGVWPLC